MVCYRSGARLSVIVNANTDKYTYVVHVGIRFIYYIRIQVGMYVDCR